MLLQQVEDESALTRSVPFMDLRPMTDAVRAGIMDDLVTLLDTGAFVNGPAVVEFEQAYAEFCGTAFAVGVASGLDALRFALLALELEPEDEVILPANTFIATVEAALQAGARPVLVDVSPVDYNIDISAAETAIGPRTRAVVPVHLYGQLADLRSLGELAGRRGLAVVEDACQAHGALRDGLRPGAATHAAAFSFYPAKNLGAFGDAGALVTNDPAVATRARALREHGQRAKYRHELVGYTGRLDTLQALVLLRKLPWLEEWNTERVVATRYYTKALAGVGDLKLPAVVPGSEPVWHLYVVRTADPEALGAFLSNRGIGTGRHYPEAAHLAPALARLGYGPGAFPVAEALAQEVLSLPLYPGISERQLETVVDAIKDFFGRGA
jgi:dTDP-4-amino-4,6-dideoxygalactose transaminase